MKEEILIKLRSAEEETATRVTTAQARAAEILKSARVEAARILQEAETEARNEEEATLAAERKRLETERARILEQGAERERGVRAAYEKKVSTHVQRAVAAFERSLDA